MPLRLVLVMSLVALAGCGEQAVLSYQGRPAQTAQECQAAYQEAKARPVATDYSSRGAMIGSALGKGIAEGMIDQHYQTCLARVGSASGAAARPAVASAPKVTADPFAVASARTGYGGVPSCGLKMVGGSGYACADR
ncbi:hypothetical protein [Neotabrizicola sp. VNH66]|uniref:hypothetical protein n=1 Tax=Neotabrizicola sp. VNH66 TaxID=3400918 RepID=UPI003C03318B